MDSANHDDMRPIVITDEDTGEMVRDLIDGLRGLGMSTEAIASRIQAPARTVYAWRSGLQTPSLPYWLRLERLAETMVYMH